MVTPTLPDHKLLLLTLTGAGLPHLLDNRDPVTPRSILEPGSYWRSVLEVRTAALQGPRATPPPRLCRRSRNQRRKESLNCQTIPTEGPSSDAHQKDSHTKEIPPLCLSLSLTPHPRHENPLTKIPQWQQTLCPRFKRTCKEDESHCFQHIPDSHSLFPENSGKYHF